MVPGLAHIFTLTFCINKAPAGSEATISTPDENPVTVPVSISEQQKGHIIFSLLGVGQYEGILSADGKTIQGKLKLRNATVVLLDLKFLFISLPDTKAITEWARKNAIPLKTVEPQGDNEDMTPLKNVIGKARIVALGEATHGTHEFFKMKQRLFEFLVEQMGFTIFALEANMPEARSINDYVLNGKGESKAALYGLYSWPWKTGELLDMIEWMRTYNANPEHQHKIKFYGFDMQVANRAISNVICYLRNADPEYAIQAEELLSKVPQTEFEREHFSDTPATSQWIVEQIGEVMVHIDQQPHKGKGWIEARQDARVIQQAVQMLRAGDQQVALRDEAMAENVAWILEQEGPAAKIMLWAHNDHVRTTLSDGKIWLGGHLRKRFGNDLLVMGFVFNQGGFRATEGDKEPREFAVKPAMAGSLDAVLAATNIPLFAIDLRTAKKKSVIDWIMSPQKTREIGSIYSKNTAVWQIEQAPAEAFDMLIFVETTSPTHPLPTPIQASPAQSFPVQPPEIQTSPVPPPLPARPETKKPFWEISMRIEPVTTKPL